jgi:hypothetical protein
MTVGERLELVRRLARVERLRMRAPRYLFIAALAVTSLVGVRELVAPSRPAAPATPPAVDVDQAADDFAVQFARAYLSYEARRPGLRERALRPFLPEDLDLDAGFVPRSGSEAVLWAQVAENQAAAGGGRVIVVALATDADPWPTYLAVPVERRGGGALALAGYPSFVGAPAITQTGLRERAEVDDPALVTVSRRVVANYLAGERANLEADLAPDAAVSLPQTRLRVSAVDEVAWAHGVGSGAVLVTVEAVGAQGTYTLTYEVGIARRAGRPLATYVETVPTHS